MATKQEKAAPELITTEAEWKVGDEAITRRPYPYLGFGANAPVRVCLMVKQPGGVWIVRDVTRMAYGGWAVHSSELSPAPPLAAAKERA